MEYTKARMFVLS